jgi:hypothetical protein
MNPIALCSTAAIAVGLVAALPQLACMIRARSAAGQSLLGWTLGIVVNLLMAYVNHAGYHADTLAAGNTVNVLIYTAAVGLILHLRASAASAVAGAPAGDDLPAAPGVPMRAPALAVAAPEAIVTELATTEFAVLHAVVNAEAQRRELVTV